MNPAEPRKVFERLLEDPSPDHIDVDEAVRRGARLRRRRRALTAGAAAAGVAVASVAVVALSADRDPRTAVDPSEPDPTPAQVLSVTCTPDGIEVSGEALVASPEGPALEVSRTTQVRTYLGITASDGGGGGDPLPSSPTTWRLGGPPGEITLTCAPRGIPDESSTARVDVTDPGGYWRETTLADAGCPGDDEPYWAWDPGTGATPRAAVDDLLAEMSTPRRTYTAAPAEIGYVDSPSQTWLAYRNGKAYISIWVHPRKLDDAGLADPDAGYTAYPGIRLLKQGDNCRRVLDVGVVA